MSSSTGEFQPAASSASSAEAKNGFLIHASVNQRFSEDMPNASSARAASLAATLLGPCLLAAACFAVRVLLHPVLNTPLTASVA